MFMAVDLLGAVFSILSLTFKSHFDTAAAVAYSLVAVRLVYPTQHSAFTFNQLPFHSFGAPLGPMVGWLELIPDLSGYRNYQKIWDLEVAASAATATATSCTYVI
jgi:hypothetical protein